mgnify:CR=1 FL=1|tara:strand:+ start:1307 stop:2644 length:1338 start_codon:yes stop_codon:yes gene_type:complete
MESNHQTKQSKNMATTKNKDVYIVSGARTPFLKTKGKPNDFSASDLAVNCGKQLLQELDIPLDAIGEVVLGCAMPSCDEANIARLVALRLGLPDSVPAWTVMRNCASGIQAVDSAYKDIQSGRHDLVLAGGTEAMSHAPLNYNNHMTNWFANLASQKSMAGKLKTLASFRPGYLKPVITLLHGLTDPYVAMNMGQTAEELAYRFNISRDEMDEFSANSHYKLAKSIDDDELSEVKSMISIKSGKVFDYDDGLRRDTSSDKLHSLKPIFDRKFGNITAGNSSQVTDGAALMMLASEEAVKKYKLNVLAKIKDVNWAGLDPRVMGLGPVYSTTDMLIRNNLTLDDIDLFEINEAFAAQVLGCKKAWEEDTFCREHLGLKGAFGSLDMNKLNVSGGAIAVGHPIAATGGRIILRLANLLKENKTSAKTAVATLCIGGGQGGAVLLEAV